MATPCARPKPSMFHVTLSMPGTSTSLSEPPEPLSRDEENELVRRALFFIASTNAERALSERAGQPSDYVMFNHAQGMWMGLMLPAFDAQTRM